jgi:galactoside O-acetyltransferase
MGGYTDIKWKFKSIGKNVEIGNNVYFRYPQFTEIGDNVIIDDFSYFSTSVKIGNFVHIAPFCSIIGGKISSFEMGHFTSLAAGVRVICGSDDFVNGPFTNPTIPAKFRPNVKISNVTLKNHAVIGTNSVIHPSVTIEEGCAVGSMSLVLKSTKEWSVYSGHPAKYLMPRNKEEFLMKEVEFIEYYNNGGEDK